MKKYVEIAKTYMKTQLIWRWDTFIDVLLAMAKIVTDSRNGILYDDLLLHY